MKRIYELILRLVELVKMLTVTTHAINPETGKSWFFITESKTREKVLQHTEALLDCGHDGAHHWTLYFPASRVYNAYALGLGVWEGPPERGGAQ